MSGSLAEAAAAHPPLTSPRAGAWRGGGKLGADSTIQTMEATCLPFINRPKAQTLGVQAAPPHRGEGTPFAGCPERTSGLCSQCSGASRALPAWTPGLSSAPSS